MSKYGTLKDNEGNKIYPNAYYKIGDIFITTNSENPADRFGGTWEKLPDETFLMTASNTYAVKSTGGENEVTLTTDQIPSHYHTNKAGTNVQSATNGDAYIIGYGGAFGQNGTRNTQSTGGGQAHNNMPKFYAVYVWIRVA